MDAFGNRQQPDRPPGFKGFNSYAAGKKYYGSGRSMPNIGPVMGMKGYAERDNKAQARKNAIMKRLKGQMMGSPTSVMKSDLGGA